MHVNTHAPIRTHLHIWLSIVAILLIIGTIFVYSASSVYALEMFGNANYCVKKQLLGIFLGLIALCVAASVPITFIEKITPFFFASSVALTSLTLIPFFAQRVHGSSRWIKLLGVTFQPSELLKIALVLNCALFLHHKAFRPARTLWEYVPLLYMLGIPSIILLMQPDFGFTVTLLLTAGTLLFVAQPRIKYLFVAMASCIPIVIALILKYPYRLKRVLTFLNPWQDPQGAGFQIIQSLIAIGSGGAFGTGIGHSNQKFFYLPMQHTDFIFAIIAEETGFVGSIILITLYILLLYFGLRIACALTTPFAIFTTIGFTTIISLQALINITVATGLAPTKGTGLPFVSYGSTALISNLIMVGIVINLVKHSRNY